VSRRIAAIEESATLAVDARAKALRAEGHDVIGFGAGEPDFPTPAHIVAAAAAACSVPRNHRYTPAAGLPELREAVAAKTTRDSGFDVAPSQVVITNGAKQAVYNSFAALLDPAGGVPVPVATDETTGFRVPVEALEAACTPRTKVLLFVSPSNPTGAVYSPQQVAEVGRWASERGLWVVTDEIYEHLVYGDYAFSSMPGLVPDLVDRTVVVNGVAKTYAMTGWRVGWMVGPADVIKAAANLQSHATSNVANVCQMAALAALTGDQACVGEMRAAFDRRRRRMHGLLADIPGVTCLEPEGAFYAFPSLVGVLGREVGGRTAATTLELAEIVLDEAKVAIVPGEAFGAPGYARLSYALADEALEEGIGRLAKVLAG